MAKEKLELNKDKKIKTSKGKNVLLSGLLAAAFMTGCGDGKGTKNASNEGAQVQTEVAKNEVVYKGKGIEGVDGILLCENPETMRLFLSDGKEKLTDEFDDIQNVSRMDGVIYFVGINNGKPAIVNENGDIIFSGLDWIGQYRVMNGDVAVVGEKNIGEKGSVCRYVFNDSVIYEGNPSRCWMNIDSKNGIYVTVVEEKNSNNYAKLKSEWKKRGSRLDDSYVYIVDGFVNDKKISTSVFPLGYYGEDMSTRIMDYGEKSLILSNNFNGKDGTTCTVIYDGKTIGSNLNSRKFINRFLSSEFLSYEKNGKRYILFPNGKEYILDNLYPNVKDAGYLFINDGKKSYIYTLDGEFCEYEGNYDNIVYADSTSDGKIYFIGKKGNKEDFVMNGKVMGKDLDHISGAGLLGGGGVYVRGERDGKKIFVLNGTERGDDKTTFDSQERETDLFTR